MQLEAGHWYTLKPGSDLQITTEDFVALEDADLDALSDGDTVDVFAINEIGADGIERAGEASPPVAHLRHFQRVDGEQFGEIKSYYDALGFYCSHGCGELLVTGEDVVSLYLDVSKGALKGAAISVVCQLYGVEYLAQALTILNSAVTIKTEKTVEWFDKVDRHPETGHPICHNCGGEIEY